MDKNNVIKFQRPKKEEKPDRSKGFPLYMEGVSFYNKDKDDIALKKFRLAELAGYVSCDMFASMAWIYGAERNYEKCRYYAQKAIDVDPSYGFSYCVMANSYYKEGDYQKSLDYNLLSIEKDYYTPVVYRQISEDYLNLRPLNALKAIEYATKAIDFEPNNSYSYYWKGWVYNSLNEYENAIKFYKKAEKIGECSFELFYELSYCYSMVGKYDKALEYANKAIFVDKDNPMGPYRKGFNYYMQEEDDKAEIYFLQAEKLGCTEADMYLRLVYIYFHRDDFDNAWAYSEKALKLDSTNQDVYYWRAAVRSLRDNNLKSAYKELQKAYSIDKNMQYMIYRDLIATASLLHRRKQGLEYLEQAFKIYPDDYLLLQLKLGFLCELKEYKKAETVAKRMLKLEPANPWSKLALADVSLYLKKYDVSIKILKSILNAEFDESFCYENRARWMLLSFAYYHKKDYDKSLSYMCEFCQKVLPDENMEHNKKEFRLYYSRLKKKIPNDERLEFIKKAYPQYLSDI